MKFPGKDRQLFAEYRPPRGEIRIYEDIPDTTKISNRSYYATEREISSPRKWRSVRLTQNFNHKATKSVKAVSSKLNATDMLEETGKS